MSLCAWGGGRAVVSLGPSHSSHPTTPARSTIRKCGCLHKLTPKWHPLPDCISYCASQPLLSLYCMPFCITVFFPPHRRKMILAVSPHSESLIIKLVQEQHWRKRHDPPEEAHALPRQRGSYVQTSGNLQILRHPNKQFSRCNGTNREFFTFWCVILAQWYREALLRQAQKGRKDKFLPHPATPLYEMLGHQKIFPIPHT